MKKEILRINNLNYRHSPTRFLENISFCALAGECIGFVGLTYSGKNLLSHFLCGDFDDNPGGQDIRVCDKRIFDKKELKEAVYRISASNYVIDDWSVAEYIGLVDANWFRMIWKKRTLEEKAAAYFDELDIPFDVSRKLKELSELEKRIVDLVKAKMHGAKILLIEDEFEGMREESICKFRNVMKRLILSDMTVIVNTNSDTILSILPDKYIIFKKGHIVKKCKREYIRNSEHLEQFLLDNSSVAEDTEAKTYERDYVRMQNTVYRLCSFRRKDGKKETLDFSRGEVVSLLVLDSKEKERLFLLLSGRMEEENTWCILENKALEGMRFSEFVKQKVVSVMHLGSEEEVFTHMSAGENLLLPSLRKVSSLEYIMSARKMSLMLEENIKKETLDTDMTAGNLEINDLISITLERWYIYNPKVLVLLEPFALCDITGVSIVKDYIKKFAARGTAVIIIKSREEYVENISNRMINID